MMKRWQVRVLVSQNSWPNQFLPRTAAVRRGCNRLDPSLNDQNYAATKAYQADAD